MQSELNLLESLVLPKDHPARRAEREKAEQWRVDFSREGELGFVAVKEWVAIDRALSQDVVPQAA